MMNRQVLASLLLASLAVTACAQTQTNHEQLRSIASQSRIRAEAEKREAQLMARLLNLPEKALTATGQLIELVAFRNGRPLYVQTDNANAAISTRADRVHPGGAAGLSLTGSGVLVGIWDGGRVRTTHQEFGGRVTAVDLVGNSDHATHVAGTIVAAGVNASAKGMSFQGSANSYDWNSDDSEMATAGAAGLRLSNHSYGYITGWYASGSWYWYGDVTVSSTEDPGFGIYESTAQAWDQVAYNAPYYLIVKSAGNDRNQGPGTQPVNHYYWEPSTSAWTLSTAVRNLDGNGTGYDTISYNGVAKNIMTVGAVNDVLNYTGPGSVTMSGFSAWGPTDDGRIKPDIVGNGVGLTSSVATSDTTYASYSGTSMSGPNVTGSLGLLVQHQRNLFGTDMLAATLKGLVIHTADEAGANPGPDYAFGWGLMNTERAALTLSADVASPDTVTENVLTNGGTHSLNVYSDGSQPLRVTICWTDPAGTPPPWSLNNPTLLLVNDLDLRVTGPGGTSLPWVLNPASPATAATTGDNFRDNVEQVLISTPAAGNYTITVTHKGASLAPAGSQAFSMIVTGQGSAPVPAELTNLSLAVATIEGGQSTTGTVTLSNTSGGTVDLSSDNAAIQVPSSVTVGSGSSSANFNVTTSVVASTTTGTVTATMGAVTKTANLEVAAAPTTVDLDALSISPGSVYETNGATGTVSLNGAAPAGGASVAISQIGGPAILSLPGSVSVGAGATSANFAIGTGASGSTSVNTTVQASYNGVNRAASLTVMPIVPNLLTLSPTKVKGGVSATGTVRVNAAPGAGGVSVALSSNSVYASVPSSVTIPAGATSATFTITTTRPPRNQTARISATRNGVTVSANLQVQK